MMRNRSFAALGCLFVALACGGKGPNGQQPSWRNAPANAEADGATRAPSTTYIEMPASTVQASHYNSPSQVEGPSSALSESIVRLFEEGSAAAGVLLPPRRDGRLSQALTDLAEITPLDSTPAYPLIEFAMHRYGIIEPSPRLAILHGDIDNPESILEQLRPGIGEEFALGGFERIGVGIARRGDVDLVLVALQKVNVSTKPIARELAHGGSASIEGTLGPGFVEPHAFHTDDSGRVHALSVARVGGDGFRTLFSCGSHSGRQQVEITAADTKGSTVLANFPVWCGTRAPRTMRVSVGNDDAPPKTREEAEARMLQLVNQDRAAHNLSPLTLDPRITAIARLHSDEMLSTGVVAHVSARTGSADDRIKAGGVRTSLILENVARGYGVADAQLGLMNSPGHRANVLSEDVNHIGIGITLGKDVAGRKELLVTQVFIYVPAPIRVEVVRSKVEEKIHSIKSMTSSSELRRVAQVYASELASGVSNEDAAKHASETLDTAARGFARISTLVTAVANINVFDPAGSLGGEQVRYHGIGIAQGDHPVMGEGAIYIVVLLGQK